MIVLDASGALAHLLTSQRTPAADAFFLSPLDELIAPAIFAFEVRNALMRAERRRFIDAEYLDRSSERTSALVDLRQWSARAQDFVRLIDLARQETLSLFDAAYLDLALREGADLASRDGMLLAAARRRAVPTHDLR